MAVLLGGLGVDLLGTLVSGVLIGAVWATVAAARGATVAQIEASLQSFEFAAWMSVVGLSLTTLGGYVAARWARRRPVAHGVGAGALSLVLASPLLLLPGSLEHVDLTVVGTLLQLPLAGCGGYLAGRRAA